ncbi:transposable element Tcb2 transposase [Trichonephila clavipes]|nr:transposable element Tcb2 transposase [Trichonephila clavipes]
MDQSNSDVEDEPQFEDVPEDVMEDECAHFCPQPNVRFGNGVVMASSSISIDGHTDNHSIRVRALTGHRYRDEILRFINVPYAATIGEDVMLMNHKYKAHRAYLVDNFFFEEGITGMEWPTI